MPGILTHSVVLCGLQVTAAILSTSSLPLPVPSELPVPLIGWNASNLQAARSVIASGKIPPSQQPAVAALRSDANIAVSLSKGRCPDPGPWSVTKNPNVGPSGDPHDLYSYATYAWPCNFVCNTSTPGWPSINPNCSLWWAKRPHQLAPGAAWPVNESDCNFTTGLPWCDVHAVVKCDERLP